MNMLKANNISVNINGKSIVKDVSFTISDHDIMMVIGPNGAGKTTLIKAIMQNLKHSGTAYISGRDISTITPRELAREVAVLTQKHSQHFAFTVTEVVSLGRYAHLTGIFSRLTSEDQRKIDEAMHLTDTFQLKDRSVMTLSGGELQRVFLASVFAQDPKILILDEPTNHLDLQHQIGVFDTLSEWVKGDGRAVLAVVHDLNIAYTYGTKALMMKDGTTFAYGSVESVLDRDNLREVYDIDVAQWMQNLLKHWTK